MQDSKQTNSAFSAPAAGKGHRHKTLVFHIGDHKTGSTAIQSAFAQRRVSLEGRKVLYPTQLSHNPLRQHCDAYAATNAPKAREKAISVFENLATKIRTSDADFCLISAEELEGVAPAVFHEIVTTYFANAADEIRVIAYVRPHAGRLVSTFAERTKRGVPQVINGNLDTFFETMIKSGSFSYEPRFSAWRDLFGSQFALRPMIRSQLYQGSVVDDFIHHAFGGTPFQIKGAGEANESLALEDLMRLKALQFCLEKHGYKLRHRHALGWEFSRVLNSLPPLESRTKLRIHKALAVKLQDAYLKDARAVDQNFFDGAPLMEAELVAIKDNALDTPQSVDPADYLSATDLRSVAILSEIIAGMLVNKGEDWPKFLKNKRIKDAAKMAQINQS
jgi:hypothetical protein